MKKILRYRNEQQLSYAEYGNSSGYPILIQHGLIASIEDHELFDSLIERNLRLICIARPGYGDSSPYLLRDFAEWAELVSFLIQDLNLARFDILAMSSGAPYGYSIASRFAGRIGSLFILSGIPALYDEAVLAEWPYPPIDDQRMPALQDLAQRLFFQNVTEQDLQQTDIRDSLQNNAFGVAQDLRLRFAGWGFRLEEIEARVFMQHSKQDDAVPFSTAVRTSQLLPDCHLELMEQGPHFSKQVLDDFIRKTVLPNIE
jgi:pimeloyl-ACP methyl ester carboxylesterase